MDNTGKTIIIILTLILAILLQTTPTIIKQWESGDLGGYVRSVSWSPKGDKLAASVGNKVIVFLVSPPRTPRIAGPSGTNVATTSNGKTLTKTILIIVLAGVGGGVYSFVRGRFILEDIKGEIISGVGGALRVRVRNPGLWSWRGKLTVKVDNVEVYSGEVRLAPGESKIIRARFKWTPELGPGGRRSSGG